MKLYIWLGKVANLIKTSCMFLVLSVSACIHLVLLYEKLAVQCPIENIRTRR